MRRSRFTEEQIIAVLKEHARTGSMTTTSGGLFRKSLRNMRRTA